MAGKKGESRAEKRERLTKASSLGKAVESGQRMPAGEWKKLPEVVDRINEQVEEMTDDD